MAGAGAPRAGAGAQGKARPRPAAAAPTTTAPTTAAAPASPAAPDESGGPGPQEQPAGKRRGLLDQAREYGQKAGQKTGGFLDKPAARRAPRRQAAHEAGGVLVGLIAYSLLINGVRYGQAGITGWLKAKFLNQPMQGLPNSAAGGGGSKPNESLTSSGAGTAVNGGVSA